MSNSQEDLDYCENAIKNGSLSFHAASRLLPRAVRNSCLALYAFCRLADDEVEMEELLEEFEESLQDMESEDIHTNYKPERVNKSNPISDKQSILSRIFQGRTDRY